MGARSAIFLLVFPVLFQQNVIAQSKADLKAIEQLKADIGYLSSDALEGRRTGTAGEEKAGEYIVKRYTEDRIHPYKNSYYYPFSFVYGREISSGTEILINGTAAKIGVDAFPLPFSPNKRIHGDITPDVMEQANISVLPLYADSDQANNPHFEAEKYMYEHAKESARQGATGVVFYDSYGSKWVPTFNSKSEYEQLDIPVVFVTKKIYDRYITQDSMDASGSLSIDLNISINKIDRHGNNIAAYIDNGAPYTVIVGAHYDHLGYGEDGNSLFANAVKEHQVHHGADDNASGTAAVLQIAQWAAGNRKLHHFNYLFVNFSGEELGLYGSKAFIKDQGIDSAHMAYMINLDMVGRLNDSTHSLELGGIGTSPRWAEVPGMAGKDFKLSIDSSGVGPSDHTSFYYAGIPVLFFFTGSHKDYHKPSDKADLINYPGELLVIKYVERIISALDKEDEKLAFRTTKQSSLGRVNFKVTLGIMPDYTFESGGVRVDGVSDNRPAMKAGIKQGDIITQLGDYKVMGMQSYMEALSKFTPGDKTQVTVMRGDKQLVLPIELAK